MKRKITPSFVVRVGQALDLSPLEIQDLVRECLRETTGAKGVEKSGDLQPVPSWKSRHLSLDLFHVVADWYCFAILAYADVPGAKLEARELSRKFGITELQARVALERLEQVGLIERMNGPRGMILKVCPDYVLSPQGIPSEAIRKNHREYLQKAIDAIDQQTIDERELVGINLALDDESLISFKRDLHRALDQLVERYSQSKKNKKSEVYHLETALFRLTRSTKKHDQGEES